MGHILNEVSTIYSDQDTLERAAKNEEYMNYIKEHVNNVLKAFSIYFLPLLDEDSIPCSLVSSEELKTAIKKTAISIQDHDISKYSEAEFDAYRLHFHPTEEEKLDDNMQELQKDKFEETWKHHYSNNPHHPEYWLNKETGVPIDMSLDAIIEMISDWEGMTLKFGGTTIDWYEKEKTRKGKLPMTDRTRDIVEDLLYNVLHNSKN